MPLSPNCSGSQPTLVTDLEVRQPPQMAEPAPHTPLGCHFSGLTYDKPGWALVCTYKGGYPEAFAWMGDQIFTVELREAGRIVRLAHTRSLVNEDLELYISGHTFAWRSATDPDMR